ncbi:MAG: prolyl oligopeptidase family serine peptidase, partial [Bacteroidetes bacterium]|nr:prolyl oligopeptidase family serine peptidase [Bacteroidota bacterium]
NKKVFNISPSFTWFKDSTGLTWYTQDATGKTFNKLDLKNKRITPLFDQQRLAKILSDTLKKEIKATDLPFYTVRYADKTHLEFTAEGKEYSLNTTDYSLTRKNEEEYNEMEEKSPDGKWIAYSKDHNLYIRSTTTSEVKQLSHEGIKDYDYASWYGWGEIIEGENGERPPHFVASWSPDSKWIQTYICDLRKGQKMYLLDWSIDTLYKPKLLSYYRGSPGDTDMVYMLPVYFNVSTGEEIKKKEFRNVNATAFEWSKTEPSISYIENRVRGYQQVDLYRFDLNNKQQQTLYSEKSATNIDNYNSQITEDGNQIIITSEKDGWKQLYLLTIKDGTLQPITNGAYYVNDIIAVDKKTKTIFFTASGKEAGRNPYYQHFYKIKMDGSGLTLLTPENANHDITLSPDTKYFTDNISTLDQPSHAVLRDAHNGKIIMDLAKADLSALTAMHYRLPEAFSCIGRDGSTVIYGAIWKPSNFDSTKKYPVIDQTYTGPHTYMFPRNFFSGIARSNQAWAELGFIVVTVDGMGTANRSKAFHNVSYKNMGKNLLDHVLAIRELGRRYSWIDTSRVGIFGHSAGGYDAGHAVLQYPDFYKVAVASSGDHDFRMEKDWWPEMYMGWPVDSTYNEVSNITMAPNLKGKLLLVHGGIDENVNPSATFKLAEALVKADKEFDMLILPSQHHGYTGKYADYFTKKRWNYFIEHLLGSKTIWDFELR